ncbi:nucleoside 2-deoxyribosyltransferase [Patescibacteria group bacterium AH-259-L07]|nr:nucleoside 2-deoxyribosyltransferase [Patescibacteria group bacterium AH-259-L07]
MYFFASPLYRTDVKHSEKDLEKMNRNDMFTKKLEENGISIILPQRDVDQNLPKFDIWQRELELIKKSDTLITVLSDTRGLYLETGFAKAIGKKILGLKVKETRNIPKDGWTVQWFDFIAEDIDELIDFMKINLKDTSHSSV